MQLNGELSIRGTIAALTAALLGQTASAGEPIRTDATLLLYSESNRVQAAESILSFRKQLAGLNVIHLDLTFDALSGPSPNGATPARRPQSFTSSSGRGANVVPAGKLPLDPSFRDTRFSLDGNVTHPLGRLTTMSLGGHLSFEGDYYSTGVSTGLTRELNRKNTTVGISGSFSHDVSSPHGGVHTPLTSMPPPDTTGEHEDDDRLRADDDEDSGGPGESKDVFDLVFGVNQVIDRRTVIRLNYSFDRSFGYLNDPYKLISVVQGPAGLEPGEPVDYLYESRPDGRSKHAVYAEVLRHMAGTTLDVSYRYFWDSWGIRSSTVDLYWLLPIRRAASLQPHVRWYHQSGADFYQPWLTDGTPLPQNASADARLAPFDGYTIGLKYALPVFHTSRLSATAEYYLQRGNQSPPGAFGSLKDFDLFPEMKALMFRIGFSHDI